MKIEELTKLYNIACNVIYSMKQKGMTDAELVQLGEFMKSIATAEFPEPKEESPIIVPTTEQVKEVVDGTESK